LEEEQPIKGDEGTTSNNIQDQKMLYAASIVKDPTTLDNVQGRYQTICDQTLGVKSLSMDNFDRAIKIMSERGWRPISITATTINTGMLIAIYLYALLERVQ
jgi:hypothetical protein